LKIVSSKLRRADEAAGIDVNVVSASVWSTIR